MKTATLDRKEFTKSRLADFATADELTRQIGHDQSDWDLVALKELVDNALDASERAQVKPEISVVASDTQITVTDNGPGIAPETIENIRNYSQKTSRTAAYVSPTRGQQGNALQTILAMEHAATGGPGVTTIESRGRRHVITFGIDMLTQEPIFTREVEPIAPAQGATIRLNWHNDNRVSVGNMVADFALFNQHATFRLSYGDLFRIYEAIDPKWRKWLPTDPTSPHWYDVSAMKNLMAAEIRHGPRTLADFLTEFRGLSGSAHRRDICETLDANRVSIAEFLKRGDGAVRNLLILMSGVSKPVKPRDLGVIGERAILGRLNLDGVGGKYKRVEVEDDGVPYLAEVGFVHRPKAKSSAVFCGVNFTASVGRNPFDDLGGEGLNAILANQYCDQDEPIALALHLSTPKPEFTDRGKSSITLPLSVDEAIADAIRFVTKAWAKQRKAEERSTSARLKRLDAMAAADKPMSIRAAAFSVMAQAYAAASGNGAWWADARQIYYAARGDILRVAEVETVDSGRFTQGLLIDYMREHAAECAEWRVSFDDRGHLLEPHTGREIGLGTLAVRDYIGAYAPPELIEGGFAGPHISTHGPEGRYNGLLYVEKEGFDQLLDQAQIGNRFDLAPMSCKGMSVTAARQLVDQTCARFKIQLYIFHDFDVSGFSIANTLHRSNRRFEFTNISGEDFRVVDFGLRLADVERLGLASEPVSFNNVSKAARRDRLRTNGATEREIEFLLTGPGNTGQRVELNAMTSPQFVALLEEKLAEHGVGKVIPSADKLADAYRLFLRGDRARLIVEEALAAMATEEIAAPTDLETQVRAYLDEHSSESWDQAVAAICGKAQ